MIDDKTLEEWEKESKEYEGLVLKPDLANYILRSVELIQALRAERIDHRHTKRQLEAKTKMMNHACEKLEAERKCSD